MSIKNWILNSIVFKEQLDKGIKQADLVSQVSDLGLNRFEVRREFLKDLSSELKAIKTQADLYGIELFYSVNEDFLYEGKPNPLIKTLMEEANILGAPFIKINVGDARGVTVSDLSEVADWLTSGIGIRLENNQDPYNAKIENCLKVMDLVKEAQLPISFVFDTANWVFVGDDVEQAVQALAHDTTYLHIKNYKDSKNQLEITTFFEGDLNLLQLLEEFPNVAYVALEYPATFSELSYDLKQLGI